MCAAEFSVCIATYGRPQPLKETLRSLFSNLTPQEVIVCIDGCKKTLQILPELRSTFPNVKFIDLEESRGPGCAKDVAIRSASCRWVLVVDDDIEFLDAAGVEDICKELDRYAVIQNLILDDSGTFVRSYEYPSMWKKRRARFEISYFVGAIHWLDRDAYTDVDGYSDFEGYGFEELALSLKLLRSGRRLLFWDCMSVKHFRAPGGRADPKTASASLTRNRLLIAKKFFPVPFCWLQSLWWAGRHRVKYGEWISSPDEIVTQKLTIREIFSNPRVLARSFR